MSFSLVEETISEAPSRPCGTWRSGSWRLQHTRRGGFANLIQIAVCVRSGLPGVWGGCWLPGSHDFVRPAVACANVPASRLGDLLHHAGVCEVGSKAPNAKVNTDYQSESRADRGRPRNALSPRSSHTGTTFVELNRGRRCFCRVEGTTVMVTVTSRL